MQFTKKYIAVNVYKDCNLMLHGLTFQYQSLTNISFLMIETLH